MKQVIKIFLYPIIFVFGLLGFLFTKRTYYHSYAAFRFLFVLTDGRSNDLISYLIKLFHPKYGIKESVGIIGKLDNIKVAQICEEISRTGYYIFCEKLNEEKVNALYSFGLNTPVHSLNLNNAKIEYNKETIKFDPKNPISPRYQYFCDQLLSDKTISELIFDKNLLHIANNYIGSKPILDIITMWWSVPFGGKGASQAAQMYHFDMDRFKFLKFFFYITDVTSETGPHCYIRSTNKRIPNKIRKDGRITDEELQNYFNKEEIVEIIGKKGSIIAVDTRGLHKGKPLTEANRLLFQLQFSNSLFGADYDKFEIKNIIDDGYKKQIKDFNFTYSLFS